MDIDDDDPQLDPHARLARMFQARRARLERHAVMLGVHPNDVADVLQDAWLIAARRAFDWRSVAESVSFLLNAVRLAAMRYRERRGRERRMASLEQLNGDGHGWQPETDEAESPEALARRAERDAILCGYLAERPDHVQDVLWRRYIDDEEARQIGEDLGRSSNAIHLIASREAAKLRRELPDLGHYGAGDAMPTVELVTPDGTCIPLPVAPRPLPVVDERSRCALRVGTAPGAEPAPERAWAIVQLDDGDGIALAIATDVTIRTDPDRAAIWQLDLAVARLDGRAAAPGTELAAVALVATAR
ncbi:MAG: sigma-70 family RNA polymerase sigma factor [Planctomycetes bacterium]|nr:sigma-70 family RNA polymerase sigma factor [Planctomycetota bacterium]